MFGHAGRLYSLEQAARFQNLGMKPVVLIAILCSNVLFLSYGNNLAAI